MLWRFGAFGLLALMICWSLRPASAQYDAELRGRVNQGTVSIISGGVTGTYIRIASDLAAVLDQGDKLRILPIVGKGSVQNITDILYLKGIDIGIVQSDALSFIKSQNIHPTISKRIRYITKLYNEEFHLLGTGDVKSIEDLAGKKVNFGIAGSGTNMTASTVFQTLNIDVEPVSFDQALALEKLKSGEISAMVYVAGKPAELFRNLEPSAGIHLVPVPATTELLEIYLPSQFSNADYPLLVQEGQEVETLAVGAVMAVYNWDQGNERYGKVEKFVNTFFDKFDEFLKSPRHPKWREVNLAAVVPGWTRFGPAENWLNKRESVKGPGYDMKNRQMFEAFLKFMRDKNNMGEILSEEEQANLYNQFLQWQYRRQDQ